MTAEITPTPQDTDSLIDERVIDQNAEISRSNFQALTEVAEDFSANRVEFVGMTVYGSTARGEANEVSDVDLFVFMKPDNSAPEQDNDRIPLNERMRREDEGPTKGTVFFNGATSIDYKMNLLNVLQAKGIDKADIDALPIDEQIVASTVSELLESARIFEEEDKSIGALVPRNIRGLFHIPVKDGLDQLEPYRRQVIERLQASPYGERAWKMIRHQVIGFEKGRNQDNFDSLSHRDLPVTLGEVYDETPKWMISEPSK